MIRHWPDPILGEKAAPRPVDESLRAIGDRLRRAAEAAEAYGLAAQHVGAVAPVVVVSVSPPDAPRDYRVLYNPELLAVSGPEEKGEEGSVALPGLVVDIMRPSAARIGFDDESGVRHELELLGFAARVAMHEIDQMNGVFFLERLSRLQRERALKRFKKQAS